MTNQLADLLNRLKTGQMELTEDLPVFGPDHGRSNREGIWSWDATHDIVGTCVDDLRIVGRTATMPADVERFAECVASIG